MYIRYFFLYLPHFRSNQKIEQKSKTSKNLKQTNTNETNIKMLGLFFGIRVMRRALTCSNTRVYKIDEETIDESLTHKQCRFCHTKGHTIVTCKDPGIKKVIDNNTKYMNQYHEIFPEKNTNTEIVIGEYVMNRLQKYSDIELAILANEYYIVTSLPRNIHIDILYKIFIKSIMEEIQQNNKKAK